MKLKFRKGLEIVQRQLSSRTVKAGEEELFKARARESGSVKIIDIVTARLDAKTDSYVATLPSLRLNDVRVTPEMVQGQ
jgi:ATP-dependent Lon protease